MHVLDPRKVRGIAEILTNFQYWHVSLNILDYVYFIAEGKIVAQGTPHEVRVSTDPFVKQFVQGEADGPVRLHYAAADYATELGLTS